MDLLVEQTQISCSHPLFKQLCELCHKSKNLYNSTLYTVRQHFFEEGTYLSYYEVNKLFIKLNQKDYRDLPAKVAQKVQMKVDKNFKSFFALNKKYKNGEYKNKPHIPRYLKKDGYFVVEYEKKALSFATKGYIKFSGTNIYISTNYTKSEVQAARIVPKNDYFIIEIIHKVSYPQLKQKKGRYASIDFGVNNLMTVTSNVFAPFIINGRPIKSINYRCNKAIANIMPVLVVINQQYTSHKVKAIWRKKCNRINNYMHNSASIVMNYLVSNDIDTLVVGYNKEWKQNINLGAKNNQNFSYIPFYKLKQILTYKCAMHGINIVFQEESYTSKCSFLDNEPIKKKGTYLGKRVFRGLFRSSNGTLINADVNGSLNILRKYVLKQEAKEISYDIDLVKALRMPSMFLAYEGIPLVKKAN